MDIYLILKIVGLAWFISTFEPIQWFIEPLPNNIVKYLIVVLTSCFKCCSFWIGLCMGGIWYAVAAAYISYLYTKIKTYNEQRRQRDNERFVEKDNN